MNHTLLIILLISMTMPLRKWWISRFSGNNNFS